MKKADPASRSIPCLMCRTEVQVLDYGREYRLRDIMLANFEGGVHCATAGNYGSQALDGDGTLHFVICDSCIIRNSERMLYETDEIVNAGEHYEEWFE